MAVIIQNISERNGQPYGKGTQTYVLRINDRILCKFQHEYEKGVAECLRQAADAVENREAILKMRERRYRVEYEDD